MRATICISLDRSKTDFTTLRLADPRCLSRIHLPRGENSNRRSTPVIQPQPIKMRHGRNIGACPELAALPGERGSPRLNTVAKLAVRFVANIRSPNDTSWACAERESTAPERRSFLVEEAVGATRIRRGGWPRPGGVFPVGSAHEVIRWWLAGFLGNTPRCRFEPTEQFHGFIGGKDTARLDQRRHLGA
jgi:hypothetical protein